MVVYRTPASPSGICLNEKPTLKETNPRGLDHPVDLLRAKNEEDVLITCPYLHSPQNLLIAPGTFRRSTCCVEKSHGIKVIAHSLISYVRI